MVYIIMVLWCSIGDGLYYHGRGVCCWKWFILSWYCGVLLVMVNRGVLFWMVCIFMYSGVLFVKVNFITVQRCVIGDGLYHHGTIAWFL